MTIAGHTFYLGRCGCGRMRSDLMSIARETIRLGKTLVDELDIAHTGRCTTKEWTEIVDAVVAEDRAIQMSMASV